MDNKYGKRLGEYRESLTWKKADMARHLGVSPSTYSRMESGEIGISLAHLEVLLDLGMSPGWFFGAREGHPGASSTWGDSTAVDRLMDGAVVNIPIFPNPNLTDGRLASKPIAKLKFSTDLVGHCRGAYGVHAISNANKPHILPGDLLIIDTRPIRETTGSQYAILALNGKVHCRAVEFNGTSMTVRGKLRDRVIPIMDGQNPEGYMGFVALIIRGGGR